MSEFKVGDCVRAVNSAHLCSENVGKWGRVQAVHEYFIAVAFDDGAFDDGSLTDFELASQAVNTEALKDVLKGLHKQFLTAGDSIPAFYLKEVISEHFGVTWQGPQEGRWVEKAE